MASTREIRRRIKSVRNTAQITKAMQMVASSKMVRAQQSALNGRPFATMAIDLMSRLAADSQEEVHPLMAEREIKKRALIVVSTDKGLCGALNSNLFREVAKYDPAATVFIAVGRKAAQFLARARRKLAAEFSYHDTPDYADCRAISRFAQELFLKGEVDVVEVMFTRFINTLSQRPEALVLLPSGSVESKRAPPQARGQGRRQTGRRTPAITSSSRTLRSCWTACCNTFWISRSANYCSRPRPANTAPGWWP